MNEFAWENVKIYDLMGIFCYLFLTSTKTKKYLCFFFFLLCAQCNFEWKNETSKMKKVKQQNPKKSKIKQQLKILRKKKKPNRTF